MTRLCSYLQPQDPLVLLYRDGLGCVFPLITASSFYASIQSNLVDFNLLQSQQLDGYVFIFRLLSRKATSLPAGAHSCQQSEDSTAALRLLNRSLWLRLQEIRFQNKSLIYSHQVRSFPRIGSFKTPRFKEPVSFSLVLKIYKYSQNE